MSKAGLAGLIIAASRRSVEAHVAAQCWSLRAAYVPSEARKPICHVINEPPDALPGCIFPFAFVSDSITGFRRLRGMNGMLGGVVECGVERGGGERR